MKKFLMMTAAFALLSTTAQAKVYTLFKGGYWETFGIPQNAEGNPMCGITTGNTEQRIYIKWDSQYGTRLSVWKKTWNIDPDAPVAFKIEFVDDSKPVDKRARIVGVEKGWAVKTPGAPGTSVFMDLDVNDVPAVLNELTHASRINVIFPDGDEPTWHAKGEGSKGAVKEFDRCITQVRQAMGAPANKSTSPVGKSTTSPVGKSQPVVKKDNGSI